MREFTQVKIPKRIWRDRKFRALSYAGKAGFFALLFFQDDECPPEAFKELAEAGIIRADPSPQGWAFLETFGCVHQGFMTGLSRKWISKAIRIAVFARDGFACVYCGGSPSKLQLDHVTPVSKGGTDDFDNLVTACKYCNASKGNKSVSEWRAA